MPGIEPWSVQGIALPAMLMLQPQGEVKTLMATNLRKQNSLSGSKTMLGKWHFICDQTTNQSKDNLKEKKKKTNPTNPA